MNIIIATGASGGHLFPSIEVAHRLKKENCNVHFIGTFGVGKERISNAGFLFDELQARGFQSQTVVNKILALFSYIKTTIQSLRLIKKQRADVIVGFGGYGAFPVVLAGCLLRVPTIIHEQNVIPGKANKFLARFVHRIAISFKESSKHFSNAKTVLTGCPIKKITTLVDRENELNNLGFTLDRVTLLVFGGSQGSARINDEICGVFEDLNDEIKIQAIHITGRVDNQDLKAKYEILNIPVVLYEFCNDMNLVYGLSDVVVARSGASTVMELAASNKQSVLIPYPFANNHQKFNAQILSNVGLASVVEEGNLTKSMFKDAIIERINNLKEPEVESMELNKVYFPNADELLSTEIIKLAK